MVSIPSRKFPWKRSSIVGVLRAGASTSVSQLQTLGSLSLGRLFSCHPSDLSPRWTHDIGLMSNAVVLALGGGVIGDLVGFAAATL